MINKKGFTLLEIMISVVILVLAFMPVVKMVSSSTTGIAKSAEHTNAAYTGRYIIEKIIERGTYDFDGIVSEGEKNCCKNDVSYYMKDYMKSGMPISETNFSETYDNLKSFKSQIDVEILPKPPGVKKVTVKIKWPSRGKAMILTLSTIIYRR